MHVVRLCVLANTTEAWEMKRFTKFLLSTAVLFVAWASVVFKVVDLGLEDNVDFVVRAVRTH